MPTRATLFINCYRLKGGRCEKDARSSSDLYQCVNENYGRPEVWGRYLGDKEGVVSTGLTSDEASFLHDKGLRISF